MKIYDLRQQLSDLADLQATLDKLKLDIQQQLKESIQPCTEVHEIATAATGIKPFSGLPSV